MNQRRVVTNVVVTIAFAIVCLGGLAYFAAGMGLGLPGQSGYQVNAVFSAAEGLVPQSEVRIAGVKVGHVLDVTSTPDGHTLVSMSVDSGIDIPSDSRAVIRPKSPLGEQFVEIIRMAGSGAKVLSAGGTIPLAQTGQSVQLDDALSSMDPQTRAAMQASFRELGIGLDGQAANVNSTIPELDQTAANLRPLARIGQNRQQQMDRILTDLNTIMQALADEHSSLGQIIKSGDQTMSAIAQRDSDLAGVLQQLAVFFTYLDQVFADLTPSDRLSLERSPASLQAQLRMLNLTGPQVDQLIPEILLGEVNYPNNELSVTHPESALLAQEWMSNFWQEERPPSGPNGQGEHALRIGSSLDLLHPSGGVPSPPSSGGSGGSGLPSPPSVPKPGVPSVPTPHTGSTFLTGDVIDFMLEVPAQ